MQLFEHPYANFLQRVEKPTRYTGAEHGTRRKDWAAVEARVCLAFPDIYDIGMSHLGFRMLYKILNDDPRTLAERAYAPWIDMQAQLKEHGKLLLGSEYIGRQKGRWIAVPTGVQTTGQIPCARIDHFKQFVGLDLTKMYPGGAPPDEVLAEAWTWDGFLAAAEKCAKAGYPFGMPLSTWSDSVNWVSAVFAAQGAQLVDGEGNITVKSDEVKEVLAWFKKIVPFLPPSVFAWDNAANNKWLISGQGALIMNPPGAWAVAVRDAPGVAEQLWTFHSPKGPEGRFDPCSFGFWGIWNFSANAAAAKSLLTYLSTRSSVEKLVAGSHGVDIPPFEKLRDFRTWEDEKPPAGTLYNYPPRGDVTALLAGYPAPTSLGTQMFAQGTICKMVAQCTQQGKSIDQAIEFAQSELEGFMRT